MSWHRVAKSHGKSRHGTSVEMCRESIGDEVGEEARVQTMDDFASHEEDFVLYPVDGAEPLKCNQGSGIIRFSV